MPKVGIKGQLDKHGLWKSNDKTTNMSINSNLRQHISDQLR